MLSSFNLVIDIGENKTKREVENDWKERNARFRENLAVLAKWETSCMLSKRHVLELLDLYIPEVIIPLYDMKYSTNILFIYSSNGTGTDCHFYQDASSKLITD